MRRAIQFTAFCLAVTMVCGCQPSNSDFPDYQYACRTADDCPPDNAFTCWPPGGGLCTRTPLVDAGARVDVPAPSDPCDGHLQLDNGGTCRCHQECPGDAICAARAPTYCTTDCDPVRNRNCRSGEHCVVGTFVGTGLEDQFGTGCTPLQAGDVGAEGDACGGTTPCGAGLSCLWPVNASGPLDGQCRRVCDVGDPSVCAGRSCTFYRQGRSGRQFGLCAL